MNSQAMSFNSVPESDTLTRDFYFRMMSPEATKLSHAFQDEESVLIDNLTKSIDAHTYNMVVIGAGPLWHLDVGFTHYCRYVAVEPLIPLFVSDQFRFLTNQFPEKIILDERPIGKVLPISQTTENRSVYIFTFNVLAYIPDAVEQLNRLLLPGDIALIITWKMSKTAQTVRKRYFNYLNSFEKQIVVDPAKTVGLCNLDTFTKDTVSNVQSFKRVTGSIIDSIIVYK